MVNYACNDCGKFFTQKSNYEYHINRKYKCNGEININKNNPKEENIENKIIEKLEAKLEEKFNEKDKLMNKLLENNFNISNLVQTLVNKNKNEEIKEKQEKLNVCGCIYLIRTREYLVQDKNIYKVGKTSNNLYERLGKYGKGGEVIFSISVEQSKLDEIEKKIIKLFKTKFVQKKDIGTEYFEGDKIAMIKEMFDNCFANI